MSYTSTHSTVVILHNALHHVRQAKDATDLAKIHIQGLDDAENHLESVLSEIDRHAKGVLHTRAGILSSYNEGWK